MIYLPANTVSRQELELVRDDLSVPLGEDGALGKVYGGRQRSDR